MVPHAPCLTVASWVRRFGEADTRALLDPKRWKSERIANACKHSHAMGSTRALGKKLPKLA